MKLLYLILAHYLGDFALQSDYMATAKSPNASTDWVHVMIAHCVIQAGGVLIITQNPKLAAGEFFAHFLIDYLKCRKVLSFTSDQLLHLTLRVLWSIL